MLLYNGIGKGEERRITLATRITYFSINHVIKLDASVEDISAVQKVALFNRLADDLGITDVLLDDTVTADTIVDLINDRLSQYIRENS